MTRYFANMPEMDLRSLLVHKRVAIQSPDEPDADSLAAGFALYRFFCEAGKSVRWFYSGSAPILRPNLLETIRQFALAIRHEPVVSIETGVLIAVGCQPGAEGVTAVPCGTLVVIDNQLPRTVLPELRDVRPYLSSCSTLVWALLKKAGAPIPTDVATALLYALHEKTNGFTEVRFPTDLDMKDALHVDKRIYKQLLHSSLSLNDLALTAQALDALEYHTEDRFVLINVLPSDVSILAFIGDLALRVHSVDIAVVFFETCEGIRFIVRSLQRETKAGELADWLAVESGGSSGGDAERAGGFIFLKQNAAFGGGETPSHYLLGRIHAYRDEFPLVKATGQESFSTQGMHAFQKLPVVQSYVCCREAFPEKATLRIRMLEGDITVALAEDTYLMVGLYGEVYPIEEAKFREFYRLTEEMPLENFLYTPNVFMEGSSTAVPLLPFTRPCVSKELRVFARQLEKGIKIFTRWDEDSYITGYRGDWVVRRREDKNDIYIIKKDLFTSLYKPIADRK